MRKNQKTRREVIHERVCLFGRIMGVLCRWRWGEWLEMRTVKKPKEEVKSRGTLHTEDFLLYPGDLDSKSVIFRSYSRKITQAVLDTVVPSRKGRDAGEQSNNLLCTSIASAHPNPAPPSLGNSAPPSCGDSPLCFKSDWSYSHGLHVYSQGMDTQFRLIKVPPISLSIDCVLDVHVTKR